LKKNEGGVMRGEEVGGRREERGERMQKA